MIKVKDLSNQTLEVLVAVLAYRNRPNAETAEERLLEACKEELAVRETSGVVRYENSMTHHPV